MTEKWNVSTTTISNTTTGKQTKTVHYMTATNTLPTVVSDADYLVVFCYMQDITVNINGHQRLQFLGLSKPYQYLKIPLMSSDSAMTLSLTISSDKYIPSRQLESVYVGDKASIMANIFKSSMLSMLLSLFMIIMSLFLFFIRLISKNQGYTMLGSGTTQIALSLLCVGIWVITQDLSRQVYFGNVEICDMVCFLSGLLAAPPFIMFIRKIEGTSFYKLNSVILYISFALTILGVILALTQIGSVTFYIDVRNAALLVLTMYTAITLIIILIRKKNEAEYSLPVYAAVIAMGILIFFGISYSYYNPLFHVNTLIAIGGSLFGLSLLWRYASINHNAQLQAVMAKARNEETSNFLEKMSHTIKTPLNAVIGLNSSILRESDDPVIIDYANDIKNASLTLLDNIADILDIARFQTETFRIVPRQYDTMHMIENIISLFSERAKEKGLHFEITVDPLLPQKLIGDDRRISQIIINILNNSLKYTHQGSINCFIGFWQKKSQEVILEVTVSDTGIGIKNEDKAALFERFSRLDETKNSSIEGSGLGLYITAQLLNLMGGEVFFHSVYNMGTDFRAVIPQEVADWTIIGSRSYDELRKKKFKNIDLSLRNPIINTNDTILNKNVIKETPTPMDLSSKRILCVDDSPLNIKVLQKMLKPFNVAAEVATNGEEAIAMCKRKKYDLIFLDHLMPGLDGMQTHEIITSDYDNPNLNTPFIMLSANENHASEDLYTAAGFAAYLSKPIDEALLHKVIVRIINISQTR